MLLVMFWEGEEVSACVSFHVLIWKFLWVLCHGDEISKAEHNVLTLCAS